MPPSRPLPGFWEAYIVLLLYDPKWPGKREAQARRELKLNSVDLKFIGVGGMFLSIGLTLVAWILLRPLKNLSDWMSGPLGVVGIFMVLHLAVSTPLMVGVFRLLKRFGLEDTTE